MVDKFIFDVDGTLTPSRGLIDLEFKMFFNTFCLTHDVYLVTGSDRAKTVEQLSEPTYNLAKRVYNCSGSDVYEGRINVHRSDWALPRNCNNWLEDKLEESSFPLRTGLHIEARPGMVNFSVVGRNATLGERKLYVKHDTKHNERVNIAALFNLEFPELKAVVGGETGIDIFPKGYDKSQIIRDFDPTDTLHFFGDAMEPTGNDYPLKKVIIDNDLGMCYNVNSWKDTRELLYEKKW